MEDRMKSKMLPFDYWSRPATQQELFARTGKYTPEVAPTPEQLDMLKAVDYALLEEILLLREVYKLDTQACLDLKEKDPQDYALKVRTAIKNRSFAAMYGGSIGDHIRG